MNRFLLGLATALVAATPALADSYWTHERSAPDAENRWCSVDTSFGDGSAAAIIVYESDDYGMFFHDPSFQLPEELSGTLVLGFEQAPEFRWQVARVNETSFIARAHSLDDMRRFIGYLTEKSEVRSAFPNGDTWRMNLQGLEAEMPAFADCLRNHLRPSAPEPTARAESRSA